jgi:glucose uptake protein GlcU
MQFAPSQASGTGYVISFAIGASIVTILLWAIRFVYLLYQFDMNMVRTYNALPSLHLRIMWLPGGIAGTLWSIGNIASMISVEKLGEGVGYSLTQSSMLVSGLWGIFYFQEVKSKGMKIKWFVSALITLIGIMLLSYEHKQ